MVLTNRVKIVIVALAGIFFVGTMLFLLGRAPKELSPAPTEPRITTYVETQFPIESAQFTENDYKFPPTIPLLNLEPGRNITAEIARSIASNLGFAGEMQSINDVFDGIVYFWTTDNASLTIRQKTKKIEYVLSTPPSTSRTRLSENELIQKAKDFVNGKNISSQAFSGFVYFYNESAPGIAHGARITTAQNADYAVVNLYPSSSDLKLITADPFSSPVSIKLLMDGTVLKADIADMGNAKKSETLYKVKTYQEFVGSLTKSKIVAFEDGNLISPDTNANPIKKVNVTTVDLVYYLESSTASSAQPVFLIQATADIENLGKNISTTLILPAIANP